MTKNIGTIDRTIRIILGIVLLSLVFILDGNIRWFGLIGLIPLITGLISNCPLYSIFGFSSCPLKNRAKNKS